MKENDKIAVFYISTGPYKILFKEFLDSLDNFFPTHKKTVMLITDGLDEYNGYVKGNVNVKLCQKISFYPWPIVGLYKMFHIEENLDPTYEYSCYFNGNSYVNKHDNSAFDFNKLTVSYHSFNKKGSPYNPWPYINIRKDSVAYKENETYEYIQSGFFFGKTSIIKKMCEDVNNMLKIDMANHVFAQWHDESYLNKWAIENPTLIHKSYIMTVYKEDIDLTRFIYLRNKQEYNVTR